jgi:hypothetical protein
MPLFEDRSAAFIVRVWCESGEVPGTVRAWRGSIEHVASGERSFFTELDAVIAFMRPHLVRLGIEEPMRFWEHVDDIVAPESPIAPISPMASSAPSASGAPIAPLATGPKSKPQRHGR